MIAYICFRLKLVPTVGFLLAGVMIGPNALELVKDQALVDATEEIGVIDGAWRNLGVVLHRRGIYLRVFTTEDTEITENVSLR